MIYKITLAVRDQHASDPEHKYTRELLEAELRRVIKDELLMEPLAILVEEAKI